MQLELLLSDEPFPLGFFFFFVLFILIIFEISPPYGHVKIIGIGSPIPPLMKATPPHAVNSLRFQGILSMGGTGTISFFYLILFGVAISLLD